MEVILNELSCTGQYSNLSDFSERGITSISELLKGISGNDKIALLKKSDFFSVRITPDKSFHEVLFAPEARRIERLRQFKSHLARLQNRPFWDDDQQHVADYDYLRTDDRTNVRITGSGIAEAHARNACILSFLPSDYENDTVDVHCVQTDSLKSIGNPHNLRQLWYFRYLSGEISIVDFIKESFVERFNFDSISQANGLNLISNINVDIFISSFENFERKTWAQIEVDDGLKYKPFNKNRRTTRFFSADEWKLGIWKFRIDQEKRCFGRRVGDKFHVIRIDLDHKLSDLG